MPPFESVESTALPCWATEVDHLIVVDIAPVPNPPTLFAFVRAMRDIDLRGITRRSEADAQLAAAIPDAAARAFLLQNLLIEEGEAHWRLNLEEFEREFFNLLDFPDLPAGTAYRGPALFVAGADSDYVRPTDTPTIRRLFPNARIVRIKGRAVSFPDVLGPRANPLGLPAVVFYNCARPARAQSSSC